MPWWNEEIMKVRLEEADAQASEALAHVRPDVTELRVDAEARNNGTDAGTDYYLGAGDLVRSVRDVLNLDPSVWGEIYAGMNGDRNAVFSLGSPTRRWDEIHTQNGVIQYSDGELKRCIQDSNLGLSFVMALRPVSFSWKASNKTDPQYGFIGQEVADVLRGSPFSGLTTNSKGVYSIRYSDFIAPMVKAVQQQQDQIKSLKAEIAELKALVVGLSKQG